MSTPSVAQHSAADGLRFASPVRLTSVGRKKNMSRKGDRLLLQPFRKTACHHFAIPLPPDKPVDLANILFSL